MNATTDKINQIKSEIGEKVCLVAVSKTKPNEQILEAYQGGQRIFGENKVQELFKKYEELPKDIEWHLIGHLQSNKVKYIVPFVSLIHAVDSFKLLEEINKQAAKFGRVIPCLLQVKIAEEDTKFGIQSEADVRAIFEESKVFSNIRIVGLMGMATHTQDESKIRDEFRQLKALFDIFQNENPNFNTLSMGMTDDYKIAVAEGSTMIRVGSAIFGDRQYII